MPDRPRSVYDSRNNVRTETIVYSDNAVKWVLRQIASVTESSSGAVMVANTFNATTAVQETSRRAGALIDMLIRITTRINMS